MESEGRYTHTHHRCSTRRLTPPIPPLPSFPCSSRLRKEKESLVRVSEAEGEALVAKVRVKEGEMVEAARAALQQAEVETEHAVNRLRRGLKE